jgi:diacylglycerol kinase family enzyme
MASVGFDAEVVHELAQRRGGAIRHSTYIKPILRTMRTWSPPCVSVAVDGRDVVSRQSGMLVVANSRQYGWRIDPASPADMGDGLLDMVFLPARTLLDVLLWVARCRTGRQFRSGGAMHVRGRRFVVQSDRSHHFQLDGDPPGVAHEMLPGGLEATGHTSTEDETGRPLNLHIGVCPRQLPVLLPCG